MTFDSNSNWLSISDFKQARVPTVNLRFLDEYILSPARRSDTFKGFDPGEIDFRIFRHTDDDLKRLHLHQTRTQTAVGCVEDSNAKTAFRTMAKKHKLDMVFLAKAGDVTRIVKSSQTDGPEEFVVSRLLGAHGAGPRVHEYVAYKGRAPPDAPPLIIEDYLPEEQWAHLYQLGRMIGKAHGPFSRRLGEIVGTIHGAGVRYSDELEHHLLFNRRGTTELKLIDFGSASPIESADEALLAELDFARGISVITRRKYMAPYIVMYYDAYKKARGEPIQNDELADMVDDLIVYKDSPRRFTNLKLKLKRWIDQKLEDL